MGFQEDKSPNSKPQIRARYYALCILEGWAGDGSDWRSPCQLFKSVASSSSRILSTVSEVLNLSA